MESLFTQLIGLLTESISRRLFITFALAYNSFFLFYKLKEKKKQKFIFRYWLL